MKVCERFQDLDDFQRLLRDADGQARSEWEQEFVAGMNERWELYAGSMFITEKQIELLERIVG